MKAVIRDRYGSPDVLRLEDVDRPSPGDDEVLVRVAASSINTADIEHLRGSPRITRLATGLTRPRRRVPGLDMTGTVEEVGRSVTGLEPGDQVWADLFSSGMGAFSEYVCASERAFAPKPPDIGVDEAASAPHSAILALQGLGRRRRIRPGMHVLINGAGGCVGPFAVQIAKALGAEVTGVDHGGKLEMVRSLGADHVIDFTVEDFTRTSARYDFILDIAATRSVFAHRRALDERGIYVRIARNLRGFFAAAFIGGAISIVGSKRMGIFMWEPNKREDLALMADLIGSGAVKPLIDRTYRLEDLPEALAFQADGLARGKLIIHP